MDEWNPRFGSSKLLSPLLRRGGRRRGFRKEMLRLRSQIASGKVKATRATPRNLAWLFSPDLPKEIAWRVFAYWNPRH